MFDESEARFRNLKGMKIINTIEELKAINKGDFIVREYTWVSSSGDAYSWMLMRVKGKDNIGLYVEILKERAKDGTRVESYFSKSYSSEFLRFSGTYLVGNWKIYLLNEKESMKELKEMYEK